MPVNFNTCGARFIAQRLLDPHQDGRMACRKPVGHAGRHLNLTRDLAWSGDPIDAFGFLNARTEGDQPMPITSTYTATYPRSRLTMGDLRDTVAALEDLPDDALVDVATDPGNQRDAGQTTITVTVKP